MCNQHAPGVVLPNPGLALSAGLVRSQIFEDDRDAARMSPQSDDFSSQALAWRGASGPMAAENGDLLGAEQIFGSAEADHVRDVAEQGVECCDVILRQSLFVLVRS